MPSSPSAPRSATQNRALGLFLTLSSLALLVQVLAQFVVGFGLAIYYSATISGAYTSETAIRTNGAGAFAASFHYWGSALLIIHSTVHLLLLMFDGTYRKSAGVWYSSLVLVLCALALQITGNLLPMDRHGVQTAVVESGIAGAAPLIGGTAHHLFLNGAQFGQNTLTAWMAAHSWIFAPVALLAALMLYYWTKKLFDDGREVPAASRWPVGLPVLLLAMLAISVPAPRGDKAGPVDFHSFGALVSWYTWPAHGLLSAAAKINPNLSWVGSTLWPGLTILFLFALPLLANRLTKTTANAILGVLLIPFVVCPILFGGPIASIVGNRDPAKPKVDDTAATKPPSTRPNAATLLAGKDLFNSVGCSGCHGKDGTNGDSGPDLTKEYQSHPDVTFYQKYVKNPKSVDPASTMPPFPDLTQDQLDKLSAWLATPPDSATGGQSSGATTDSTKASN